MIWYLNEFVHWQVQIRQNVKSELASIRFVMIGNYFLSGSLYEIFYFSITISENCSTHVTSGDPMVFCCVFFFLVLKFNY